MDSRSLASVLGSVGVALGIICATWVGDIDAQTIDRMMAVVEGRVVTLSDIQEYRALGHLFGDSVPENDSDVLEDVIENILVEGQIRQFIGIRVTETDVDNYVAQLGDIGDLPADLVRETARSRLLQREFFAQRFERFSVVTPAEVDAYYETIYVPEARRRGTDPEPLDNDLRTAIAGNVAIEKTNSAVSEWIDSLYRRSEIEVVE